MKSHKTCTGCGENKPLNRFHLRDSSSQRRVSRCKECKRSYRQRYYERNIETEKAAVSEWQKNNKERHNESNRKWRLENLGTARESARYTNARYRRSNAEYLAERGRERLRERQDITGALADSNGKHWDPSEDAFLLSHDGLSLYQKAVHLGRTYNATRVRAQRLRAEEYHVGP